MFGHRKLLTDGLRAEGVIAELTPRIEPGNPHGRSAHVTSYVFQTRVEFDDGATADVTFETVPKDWADTLEHIPHGFVHRDLLGAEGGAAIFASLEDRLRPGKTVPVRYDSGDRKKIVLDLPALQQEVYAQRPAS